MQKIKVKISGTFDLDILDRQYQQLCNVSNMTFAAGDLVAESIVRAEESVKRWLDKSDCISARDINIDSVNLHPDQSFNTGECDRVFPDPSDYGYISEHHWSGEWGWKNGVMNFIQEAAEHNMTSVVWGELVGVTNVVTFEGNVDAENFANAKRTWLNKIGIDKSILVFHPDMFY